MSGTPQGSELNGLLEQQLGAGQVNGDVLILSKKHLSTATDQLPVETEWMNVTDVAAEPDALGNRRWSLVCVLDPQINVQSLTILLARLRDLHAAKVLHFDRCTEWSFADSLALGFSQTEIDYPLVDVASTYSVFEFELRSYKQAPDWLNAKNWANPELWGKHSW